MFAVIKRLVKPVKYGIKYGKGLGATINVVTHEPVSVSNSYISQTVGLFLFPVLFWFLDPLTKKLPGSLRSKIILIFYTGFTIGSSLGTFLSASFLRNFPSSFNGATSVFFSLALMIIGTVAFTYLFPRIKRFISGKEINEKTQSELSTEISNRFLLGLESGFAIGSALGASFEFFLPGLGLIASAIGGVAGTLVGIGLSLTLPTRVNKIKPSNDVTEPSNVPHFTKSIKFGALFGSCIGIVIGTFLLPGLGSVLGGILFSGIGALASGGTALLVKNIKTHHLIQNISNFFHKTHLSNAMFTIKFSMSLMSVVGALLGTFLLPGIGTLAGCALGALIGSAVGLIPALVMRKSNITKSTKEVANEGNPESPKESKVFPLIKKVKLGFSMGSAIGALGGGIIGSVVPIVGTLLGGVVGSFIGGCIGICIPAIQEVWRNKQEVVCKPDDAGAPKEKAPSYQAITTTMERPEISKEYDFIEIIPGDDALPASTITSEKLSSNLHLLTPALYHRTPCREFEEPELNWQLPRQIAVN